MCKISNRDQFAPKDASECDSIAFECKPRDDQASRQRKAVLQINSAPVSKVFPVATWQISLFHIPTPGLRLRLATQWCFISSRAMSARDEQECARLSAYEQAMQAQAAEQEFNLSERKKWKSSEVGQEIEESRRKEAADAEIAGLQARLYQVQQQQARDSETAHRVTEARVAQERANSQREADDIAREAERLRAEAAAAMEAAAVNARAADDRAKRELQHQLQEARARETLYAERCAPWKPSCRVSGPKWPQLPRATHRETHLLYPARVGGRIRRGDLVLEAEELQPRAALVAEVEWPQERRVEGPVKHPPEGRRDLLLMQQSLQWAIQPCRHQPQLVGLSRQACRPRPPQLPRQPLAPHRPCQPRPHGSSLSPEQQRSRQDFTSLRVNRRPVDVPVLANF
jgi:hypothetical protein